MVKCDCTDHVTTRRFVLQRSAAQKLIPEATFGWRLRAIGVTGANVVEPAPRISLLPWMLHHLGLSTALFPRA